MKKIFEEWGEVAGALAFLVAFAMFLFLAFKVVTQ